MTAEEQKSLRDEVVEAVENGVTSYGVRCRPLLSLLDAVRDAEAEVARLRKTALVWHPFPAEKPAECRDYFAVVRSGATGSLFVQPWTLEWSGAAWLERFENGERVTINTVVAWAEMPRAADVLGEVGHA